MSEKKKEGGDDWVDPRSGRSHPNESKDTSSGARGLSLFRSRVFPYGEEKASRGWVFGNDGVPSSFSQEDSQRERRNG
jgi:hypothetical protein